MSDSNLYLLQPTLKDAQIRSQQQAEALDCDGVYTIFWWAIQPLTNGMVAIIIQPKTPFDVITNTTTKPTSGLTAQEQASLQTATQIQPLLPIATVASVNV